MQFNLPSNLQNAVAAYDPEKKLQRRAASIAATSSTRKKPSFPLGNPFDLIPPEVVRSEDLQRIIGSINSYPVARRYHSFHKVKVLQDNPFVSREDVYAFILHFESLWIAIWLPPEEKKGEYLFGYARAFKNNEKSRNMINSTVRDKMLEHGELVSYGKTEMVVERRLVTIKDIQEKSRAGRWCSYIAPWDSVGYYRKTQDMRKVISKFEVTLAATVPSWENTKWYERIICRNPLEAVELKLQPELYTFLGQSESDTELSVDLLVKIIEFYQHEKNSHKHTAIWQSDFIERNIIKSIISTPLIKKWIQSKFAVINKDFKDVNCVSKKEIVSNWSKVDRLLDNIVYVKSIWNDCPLDYYNSNIDALSLIYFRYRNTSGETKTWLAEHMPVASFFQIIKKFLEVNSNNVNGFHEWNDTVSMLQGILTHSQYKQDLKVPKRWRISEFHDYIQSESWKLKNDKIDLPQDLFPSPIKVETNDGRIWTFFQPIDTHQLAQWGQAVRNCIGSASHYAEEIKKKKHFIVLCNLDRKPTFTIQLKVNDGVMSVLQVVSIANRRLSDVESADYGEAFQKALFQRENQLNSGQPATSDSATT
jgi:hypothetical protein